MQGNKHISTGLAIAACALSLAASGDNDWQVTGSTEWSNSANWSHSLDDTSNELRFRAGSSVLDSDVTVTFADAYEYPNHLKFENISTLDGSGLVTFRGNTDESGLSITSGRNIYVGGYGSGGYPGNVEFAKGSYSMDNALLVQHGCATISGASLYCGGNLHLGYGDATETALNIFGGSVSCNRFYIGDKAGNKATCVMTNGTLTSSATGNTAAYIGQNGQGEFFFYGGKADFNGEFQIGKENGSSGLFVITNGEFSVASYTCIGYGNGSGKFIMDGGTFTDRGGVFIVGQGSNASATGECIVSNGVLNVQSMYISENNTRGTLTVEGGEVNVNGTVLLIRYAKSQTATVNLNGGVLSTERFDLGGGSGNSAVINFNGGTLKGVRSTSNAFIPNLGRLTVKLGEKGAIFDTAGFDLTVADTLDNADGLDHNAPIAKKGLGTLTISSSLDLDRTFKFVINGDVGPIALTSPLIAEGGKIAVEVTANNAPVGTPCALLTGLNTTWTLADNFDTLPTTDADGFYTYDWDLSGGTLSVTLGYTNKAAVTARNNNGSWDYYDANDTLIVDAPVVTASTVYYGTGTINADCDWSDLKITIPDGGALDLDGHNLKLGTYNAGSGAVITNSKAADGETSNLSVLTLGANGGVMYGNANVKFTGNLKVSLSGAADATDFGTSQVHEHTGGWLFEGNNKSIKFSPDCMGPGPLVLNGNGGFVPANQNTGDIELYVYGAGNVVKSNRNIAWNGFFKNARWHGDGEIIIDIDAAGNANNGGGIPEIGANPKADFADFRGTLKIKTNNSDSLGLFLWTEQAQTKSMASGRIVLGERGVLYHRDGNSWFSIGDLSTEGSKYDAGKKISVFTTWGAYGTANWEVGALNLDSTFAGQIADSGTTNIRKVGDGTWTLNAECYNKGTFEVNGGNLRFMRNASNANLGFTVNNGGTLSGAGTIAGGVTVNNGGILAPGDGTSGTLTIGSLAFAGTPVLSYTLAADATGSLLVSGSGTVSLDGVNIAFSNADIAQTLGAATVDRFTLITAESFSGTPSASVALPAGWEFSVEELPAGRHALVLKSTLAASYYVWTGAANDGNCANAANWAVYASNGTLLAPAVPSNADLPMIISGTLDADLSSLTAMSGARVIVRGPSAALGTDVDLSGYNVVFEDGASLDLAGHTLTLADYAGGSETAGAVTSSVSGGRLNAGAHTGLMEFTGAGNTYVYNGNHVWTGNGSNGDWNTASNWSPAVVPLETGTVTFVGNADIVSGTVNVSAMSIASGASVSFGSLVTFSCVNVVNDGTLTFGCTVAAPGPDITGSGSLVVTEGGSVTLGSTHHLRQPLHVEQGGEFAVTYSRGGSATLTQPVTGQGTFAILDRVYVATTTTFNNFAGVIDLRSGSQLNVTLDGEYTRLGTASIKMQGGSIYLDNKNGAYCSNPFEIHGTGNLIWSVQANMFISGPFTGDGEVTMRTDGGRGPRPSGDNSQFAGVFTLRNVSTQGDTGFHGANATSAAGKWIIDTDNNNRVVDFADAQNETFHVGELYQSVASTSLRVTKTGTGIVVGERSGGESVINGHFTGNAFSFTKLGADSWLTLGQGFAAVAGSTFNFSAGGICFNLPAGETEPTSLIDHTVTFDPSVKIRVAMTQAQFAALDLNEEYLVAKLPTNPRYKPETELLVDGTVLNTPAAAKWGVRFKSFPAVGETPEYIGAVLRRKSSGLMIIFK